MDLGGTDRVSGEQGHETDIKKDQGCKCLAVALPIVNAFGYDWGGKRDHHHSVG